MLLARSCKSSPNSINICLVGLKDLHAMSIYNASSNLGRYHVCKYFIVPYTSCGLIFRKHEEQPYTSHTSYPSRSDLAYLL